MPQEAFNFEFDIQLDQDDFIICESNFNAYNFIESWPGWNTNTLFIYGPPKSGKTHLAKIWHTKTNSIFLDSSNIANPINKPGCYILENIELIKDETQLFHLLNLIKETNSYLLITSTSQPKDLEIKLPDLKSRLNAIQSIAIYSPSNDLIQQIFMKQFSDRQLRVPAEVINYVTSRMERSFENVSKIVDRLDKFTLTEKKNITIPVAKQIIETI